MARIAQFNCLAVQWTRSVSMWKRFMSTPFSVLYLLGKCSLMFIKICCTCFVFSSENCILEKNMSARFHYQIQLLVLFFDCLYMIKPEGVVQAHGPHHFVNVMIWLVLFRTSTSSREAVHFHLGIIKWPSHCFRVIIPEADSPSGKSLLFMSFLFFSSYVDFVDLNFLTYGSIISGALPVACSESRPL